MFRDKTLRKGEGEAQVTDHKRLYDSFLLPQMLCSLRALTYAVLLSAVFPLFSTLHLNNAHASILLASASQLPSQIIKEAEMYFPPIGSIGRGSKYSQQFYYYVPLTNVWYVITFCVVFNDSLVAYNTQCSSQHVPSLIPITQFIFF